MKLGKFWPFLFEFGQTILLFEVGNRLSICSPLIATMGDRTIVKITMQATGTKQGFFLCFVWI